MKRWLFGIGWFIGIMLMTTACRVEQTDTCTADQQDGNWQQIIDNPDCTPAQKGEAYLALAGFDYSPFLAGSDLIQVLRLSESNWEQKRTYFDQAVVTVRPVYNSGDDAERTVFLFGIFLSLFTHLSGLLDNGAGEAKPFDGVITDEEVSRYTGIVAAKSGDGAGIDLELQNRFQIEQDGTAYLFVEPDRFYFDLDGDGIIDRYEDGTEKALGDVSFLMDPARWNAFRQVAYLKRIDNPMITAAGDDPAPRILQFTQQIDRYLSDLVDGFVALGVDRSAEVLEPITRFQSSLDNGAVCPQLNTDPAFRLIEVITAESRRHPVESGETYADANVFTVNRLIELGLDVASGATKYPGITVEPGLKLLYLNATRNDVIPYWEDAASDVREALAAFSRFNPTAVVADDGKIGLSEILCLPEMMSL
jgi:hypothetical protein